MQTVLSILATASVVVGVPTNPMTTAPSSFSTSASPVQYTSTASAAIAAAAATALTESPTSNVKGKVFDRVLQIYLETTAYENAIADRMSLLDSPRV
jgi:hypothetical protein